MKNPDGKIQIHETDAKAGSNEGVVRWVLLISLTLAIIAMTVTWLTGAFSEDAVESAGTATQREEAVADANSSDPDLAEQQDMVVEGVDEQSQPVALNEPTPLPAN